MSDELRVYSGLFCGSGGPAVTLDHEELELQLTADQAEALAAILRSRAQAARELSEIYAARPGALAVYVAGIEGRA